MALWIDRDWITSADLAALDSEVPSISAAAGVQVDGPGGVAEEAFNRCTGWLESSFPAITQTLDPVLNIGRTGYNVFAPQQVVMTEQYGNRKTPLHSWLLHVTLETFYRYTIRRAANDRLERKLEGAQADAAVMLAAVRRAGIPVALSPIACPGATQAPWSDAVGLEVVTTVAGAGSARTIYYASSFVSLSGAESALSAVGSKILAANESATLSIAAMVPGFSVSGYAMPVSWNCYVGSTPGALRLLSEGVALGTSVDIGGTATGRFASNGQVPNTIVPYRDLILRG